MSDETQKTVFDVLIKKHLELPHRETIVGINTLQTKPFDNQKMENMSNETQQSAVDYYIDATMALEVSRGLNNMNIKEYIARKKIIIDKAKEMEKEQMKITEDTSDGYHTFKDLYAIRKSYNVALFNGWAKQHYTLDPCGREIGYGCIKDWSNFNKTFDKINGHLPKHLVHKSRRHNDGEYPFGKDNWFIVSAILPTGQISNHYPMEDWDLFMIPETEKALFEFDGHTSQDVIERLLKLELGKESILTYNILYVGSNQD
jgi:hypothetical protein